MPSAVLEVPKATVLAACAIGSAAWAELDRVGPNTIATLSWKISFLKTLMASSFLPCSSSITSAILLPLMPPAALISSAASWKPLRMAEPYWAAPPDSASATPILMSWAANVDPVAIAAPAATAVTSSRLIVFCMRTCSFLSVAIGDCDFWSRRCAGPTPSLPRMRPASRPATRLPGLRAIGNVGGTAGDLPCERCRIGHAHTRSASECEAKAPWVQRSCATRQGGGARSQSRDFTGKRTTVR
jgi:hypothetical protein